MIGAGASISYESGSTMVDIPKVRKIGGASWATDKIDTTNLGISDRWKTSEPGLREGAPVTFEAEYLKSTFTGLNDIEGTVIDWEITSPEGSGLVATFEGYLTKL